MPKCVAYKYTEDKALVEKAKALIDTPELPRNGYYAFVCEKSAPTFDYYGYFLYADELKKTAGRIYERA